jgi:hypothetical protein
MRLPEKIISGGQTGADIGGLLAAHDLGIETGGVAPKGWLTEKGPRETLLRAFGLVECEEEGFAARTRRNVAISEGTLLVGPYAGGGSRLTCEVAGELNKPLFLLDFPDPVPESAFQFRQWLGRHQIRVLNVAGNRESQSPGIEVFTRRFLTGALRDLNCDRMCGWRR